MKKLLIIAFAILLPVCGFAQKKGFKLVEKSGPKPEWVGKGSVQGFIIVQSDKPTLEAVKADAMDKVRAEIASSVATNVSRTVNSYTQKTVSGTDASTNATLSIESTSKIARMPAIQGVSITKAETYQELFRNSKTGEQYYNLYVKYPFSQFDLVELVTAYEKHDQELNDKIAGFENEFENIESVEQVDQAITGLTALKQELGDDDSRYFNVEGLIKKFNQVYTNIIIEIVENETDRFVVRLMYNGKPILSAQKPRLSSNCATQFTVKDVDDTKVVTYMSNYCYSQDDNSIEVRFKFGSKYVKEKVFFKVK